MTKGGGGAGGSNNPVGSGIETYFISSLLKSIQNGFSLIFVGKDCSHLTSHSFIMEIYYKYTVCMATTFYGITIYNSYYTPYIRCFSSLEGFAKLHEFIHNYCLSYGYHPTTKNFIAYYKWVPWIYFFIIVYFYGFKKVVKCTSHFKISKCLKEIRQVSRQCIIASKDVVPQKESGSRSIITMPPEKIIRFILEENGNENTNLFFHHLASHCIALGLNISLFFFLDFCLQGSFLYLVPESWPFERNYVYFNDTLTSQFYPFVECSINTNTITIGFEEELVCHYIYMEYYEKFFIILWIWLLVAGLLNVGYIIFQVGLAVVQVIKFGICNMKFLNGGFFLRRIKHLLPTDVFEEINEKFLENCRPPRNQRRGYGGENNIRDESLRINMLFDTKKE